MNREAVIQALREQNRIIANTLRSLKRMQKNNEQIIGAVNRGELRIDEGGVPLHTVAAVTAQVISYLNGRTGKNFNPDTFSTIQLIRRLLEGGHTAEEMMKVIDGKAAEWAGTEFWKYMRPSTLFGDHFESYLESAGRPQGHSNLGELEQLAIERMQETKKST